jgi:hypothetical protein
MAFSQCHNFNTYAPFFLHFSIVGIPFSYPHDSLLFIWQVRESELKEYKRHQNYFTTQWSNAKHELYFKLLHSKFLFCFCHFFVHFGFGKEKTLFERLKILRVGFCPPLQKLFWLFYDYHS